MNLLHLRYAVEVSNTGSISKASEVLFVAQPNLSRSIKELEADLGITIFERSSRGMVLTPKGESFIRYAKKILAQVDDLEHLCRSGLSTKQRFSISVPRASYIADAFSRFSNNITADPAEIFYMETNPNKAIDNILNSGYRLGIIRHAIQYDKYFKEMVEEKGLVAETVAEFSYVLIMSNDSPLAKKDVITFSDLTSLIEISHGDLYVPSLPMNVVMKDEQQYEAKRRVFLFERGGQFDLLTENPETFMWVSPIPQKLIDRYNLTQKPCVDNTRVYRDVLIRRKNDTLTEFENLFIKELYESKKRCIG